MLLRLEDCQINKYHRRLIEFNMSKHLSDQYSDQIHSSSPSCVAGIYVTYTEAAKMLEIFLIDLIMMVENYYYGSTRLSV